MNPSNSNVLLDELGLMIGAVRHAQARALVIERQADVTYSLADRVRQQRIAKLQDVNRAIATQALNNLPRQASQLLTTLHQVLLMVEMRCTLADDNPVRTPFCRVMEAEIDELLTYQTSFITQCRSLESRLRTNSTYLQGQLNAVLTELGSAQSGLIAQALAKTREIEQQMAEALQRMFESGQSVGQTLSDIVIGSLEIGTATTGRPTVSVNNQGLSMQVLGQLTEHYQQASQGRETFTEHVARLRQAYQTLAHHNASAASVQVVLSQGTGLAQMLDLLSRRLDVLEPHLNGLKSWARADAQACAQSMGTLPVPSSVLELKRLLTSLDIASETTFDTL